MSDVHPDQAASRVEVRDISQEWFDAVGRYSPTGPEMLDVLQGMAVALGMGGDEQLTSALDTLDRFRSLAPDEYTLGAIAMLMSVCQLQVLSPQEALGLLEYQLQQWHAVPDTE